MNPAQLTREMRRLVGVPWVHQGRTLFGLDCGGFLVMGLANAQVLPQGFQDPAAYGRAPQRGLLDLVASHCEQLQTPREGTLVLFTWPRQQLPSHVGYCAGPTLIHAYQRAERGGRVVEHGFRDPWPRWMHSAWRIPTVAYE